MWDITIYGSIDIGWWDEAKVGGHGFGFLGEILICIRNPYLSQKVYRKEDGNRKWWERGGKFF